MQGIDGVDNGVNAYDGVPRYLTKPLSIQEEVNRLNYIGTFDAAVQFMGERFDSFFRYAVVMILPGLSAAQKAVENRFLFHVSGLAVFNDSPFDIMDYVQMNAPEVLYLCSEKGGFRVRCVSVSPESFTNRRSLPEAWRGLRDLELEKTSGIKGCVFVHKTGFLGVFDSSEAL